MSTLLTLPAVSTLTLNRTRAPGPSRRRSYPAAGVSLRRVVFTLRPQRASTLPGRNSTEPVVVKGSESESAKGAGTSPAPGNLAGFAADCTGVARSGREGGRG